MIAESTFTSLADVAAAMSFDWLPTRLLLSQKFDSLAKISRIRMPAVHCAWHERPHGARALFVGALRGGARAEEVAARRRRERTTTRC